MLKGERMIKRIFSLDTLQRLVCLYLVCRARIAFSLSDDLAIKSVLLVSGLILLKPVFQKRGQVKIVISQRRLWAFLLSLLLLVYVETRNLMSGNIQQYTGFIRGVYDIALLILVMALLITLVLLKQSLLKNRKKRC